MYSMVGLGYIRTSEQQEIFDRIQRLNATGSRWSQYYTLPDARVREFQQFLNRKLARLDYQIEEDGRYDWSVCAAIDALYGGPPAIDMKKAIGCAQRYPAGKTYRDFLIDLRKVKPSPSFRVPSATSSQRPYCEPPPGACFGSINEKDKAQTQAQYGYKPKRGTGPCDSNPKINPYNIHLYDPERIENLPLCSEVRQQTPAAPAPRPMPGLPPDMPLPEPEPEPEMDMSAEPVPASGILKYTDIYWGQGPDPKVSELIRTQINPALVANGYKPLNEWQKFAVIPCSAIHVVFPPEVASQFKCPNIPNPKQFLKPSGTSGLWGLGQTEAQEVVAKFSGIRRGEVSSRVEELVLDYLNPGLEAAGYLPITHHVERRRFAYRVCAAIRLLYGDEVYNQFDCRDEVPSDWLQSAAPPPPEVKPYSSESSPVPSEPDTPSEVLVTYDYGTPTIYDDDPVPSIYDDDPVPSIYDDDLVPTIYDDEPVFEPEQEQEQEPAPKDEGQTKMVVGLLVAAVVGGGAVYYMTRKKKR